MITPPSPFPHSFVRHPAIVVPVLAVAALLIYAGTFQVAFVLDDIPNIVDNPRIRMTELSLSSVSEAFKSRSANRPLANLTLALNYYFHQYQVAGYHVVNLIIHIITAFLVYLLARLTPGIYDRRDIHHPFGATLIPLLAALLWLVHPLHIQSVTYIVQRMTSLAAMFYLLSLVCYVQARLTQNRQHRHITLKTGLLFAAAALSALFALASKEIAATLPVMVFLYEWIFFQDSDRAWLQQKVKWLGAAAVVVMVVALIYLDADPRQKILSGYEKQSFTMGERLLTQPQVILYYLSLLAFPHPDRLNLIYDFPLSLSLSDPVTTGPALVALAALVTAAVFFAGRDRLLSFAILWFLVTLVIESSFIGLAMVFEHRTYLPSIFPIIVMSRLLMHHIRPRPAAMAVIMVLVAVGGIWTFQRNQVWQNELALWQDVTRKAPFDYRAYNNIGLIYKKADDYPQALNYFRQALDSQEIIDMPGLLANIGMTMLEMGDHEGAVTWLNSFLELEPGDENGRFHLGLALQRLGKNDAAGQQYEQALAINRNLPDAWSNLGNIRFSQGKTDEAVACFEKALSIDPEHAVAAGNLKKITTVIERFGPVIKRLEKAAAARPDDPTPAYQLGRVYQAAGMTDQAIIQYQQALDMNPDMPHCLNDLTTLYVDTNRLGKAVETLQQLTLLLPDNPVVFYNLACVYARQHKVEPAVAALKKAVEKGYDNWSHLATDPDLAPIHHTEYFNRLISRPGAPAPETHP